MFKVHFAWMPFSAKAVANHFLDLGGTSRSGIDPLRMQKLVYFAHGWHLALQDQPLIRDSVEAWAHGPVIPDLYHEFKRWGSSPIRRPATKLDVTGKTLVVPTIDTEGIWDQEVLAAKSIIDRVWQVYKKFSGLQLSALTHQPGSPWARTRAEHPNKRDVDIPDDLIKAYFKAQMAADVAANAPA